MNAIVQRLHEIGLVPVVKINDAAKAVPLARALMAGGLPCAEVTFRTSAAAESIRAIAQACPELIVGAGTVLTPAQVDDAIAAGAQFIVSPGFNPQVVDYCLEQGVLMMPGISDASGVEQCLARGLEVVKFFPAEQAGGLAYLQALAGPYASVKYMPTGGISPANLASYTTSSLIIACGGSWMVREDLIDNDCLNEVERLCREAVDTMLGLRVEQVQLAEAEGDAFGALSQLCQGMLVASGDAGKRIVLSTIDLTRAMASFAYRGLAFNEDSKVFASNGKLESIELAQDVDGFVVRLLQR